MRSFLRIVHVEILILGFASLAQAQSPDRGNAPQDLPGWQLPAQGEGAFHRADESRAVQFVPIRGDPEPIPAPGAQGTTQGQQQPDNRSTQPPNVPGESGQTSEQELALLQKELDTMRELLAATQGAAQQDEKLKKQVELLQKQIETQQKIIQLLADHVRKQPIPGSPVEKLQVQTATLEARSLQAARRDQDLAQAIDTLTEHADAVERNGPRLPATLKELFLPSRTNETPLSIYGQLVSGYELFPHQRGEGRFSFDEISPFLLLQLNDHIQLESEIEFHLDGVEVSQAQLDYIVNDWLTVV